MDADLARVLRALQHAADFASRYQFELTDDYLALITQVERMPYNQSGADKSGRWLGGPSGASARLIPRRP